MHLILPILITSSLALALPQSPSPTDIPYVKSSVPCNGRTCLEWTTTINHQGAVLPKCASWHPNSNQQEAYLLNGLPKSYASKCTSKSVKVENEYVTVQCDEKKPAHKPKQKRNKPKPPTITYVDVEEMIGTKQKCAEWFPDHDREHGVVRVGCKNWVADSVDNHYYCSVAEISKGFCDKWAIKPDGLPRVRPICVEPS